MADRGGVGPGSGLSGGTGPGREYWPQVDGVRAIAIAAVVAYHLGDLPGGWLGVDVFFVVSGYLITTILCSQPTSAASLRTFWARRARRLLPAVLLMLLVLSVYAWLSGPGLVPAQLRDPGLATLFYTANWQQIAAGHSYFAQFSAPSPLQHTWSLAIEEQYYLVWPLLLGGLLWWGRRTRSRDAGEEPGSGAPVGSAGSVGLAGSVGSAGSVGLAGSVGSAASVGLAGSVGSAGSVGLAGPGRRVVWATAALALASAAWMTAAYHLFGANRAYLGTDTRAWELLVGGVAAMLWPPGRPSRVPRRSAAAALVGTAGLAVGISQAGGPPSWIWNGGLAALAVAAAALVVGSVKSPSGVLSRVLACRPVRWVGTISYSLYLWHLPVIVLMTPDTCGLTGGTLLVVRLAAMSSASAASYYLVERPLRRADWAGLARRIHVPVASFAGVGVIAVAASVLTGSVGPPAAPSRPVSLGRLAAPATALDLSVRPNPPGAPYRVWLMGDSAMVDASPGITAALTATGRVAVAVNTSFPGWGLTRIHGFAADTARIIATYHPQIVIGTWEWDDQTAATSPVAYRAELQNAVSDMLRPGNGVEAVVLMQYPQIGPDPSLADPAARARAWVHQVAIGRAWDQVARQVVGSFPGRAAFLTTRELFAPGGRFYSWFEEPSGGWVRARKLDNWHFCPYGAAEFGAYIVRGLAGPLALPAPRPGWETGAWTRDPRYNDPPGACPDDQPPAGYRGTPVPA